MDADTPTPRTQRLLDEIIRTHPEEYGPSEREYLVEHARTLERELAASRREIEFQKFQAETRREDAIAFKKRADQAEAALEKAREVAEAYWLKFGTDSHRVLYEEIRALRGAQPASALAPAAPLVERLRAASQESGYGSLMEEAAAALEAAHDAKRMAEGFNAALYATKEAVRK